MKKIAIIGGYDKSDIIIYISKILTTLNSKVLIVDTTLMQKTRFIVPTMTPTLRYVTTYDSIDLAIGFSNEEDLKNYIGINDYLRYDYIIFDIDDAVAYDNFKILPKDEHCFLTSFDIYSVQKGLNVLRNLKQQTSILKVLVTRDPSSEESEYLDFITFNLKVKWKEEIVYIPFDTSDLYEIYQNQRFSKIKLSGLSIAFIDSLAFLTENITPYKDGEIRKAIRIIEKEN